MSTRSPERRLVAVVGSVDAARSFSPPLKAVETAQEACRQLGGELARAGFDLAVFSSSPKYVEATFVEGYAEACTAESPGRVAAYPARHRSVDFALGEGSHVNVDVIRDTSGEWEVSYYRTLMACDGVVLVGGGQSTRIAGIIALSQQVPVIPVAAFGGGANQVWVNLGNVRNDADGEDVALLGNDWSPTLPARLVGCLIRQQEKRDARRAREERARRTEAWSGLMGWLVAVVCMCLALAGLVVVGPTRAADARNLSVLVGAPLLASIAGAVIRNSFVAESSWGRACVRGLGAGLVTVLLYIASQLLSVPNLMDKLDVRRLLFMTIPLGFTSGFTFDLVFDRLRTAALTAPPGSELHSSAAPSGGQAEPRE